MLYCGSVAFVLRGRMLCCVVCLVRCVVVLCCVCVVKGWFGVVLSCVVVVVLCCVELCSVVLVSSLVLSVVLVLSCVVLVLCWCCRCCVGVGVVLCRVVGLRGVCWGVVYNVL